MSKYTKRLLLAVAAAALLLAGCSGGYQRGLFQGYAVGATQEEITSKVGKPDQVDNADPNAPRWVYLKKTFDPENMNKVDEKTVITFKKDASGKLVGADVSFQ